MVTGIGENSHTQATGKPVGENKGNSSGHEDFLSAPPLKNVTVFAYSLGTVAKGIKIRGLSSFLMLFYNQVMGVPAALAGTAIMIALILDGITDPIVGVASDNTPSKWGRRHPYMYLSAVPFALTYLLLWTPPIGWSDTGLVIYMAVMVILVRFFDTLYEVPATALVPELTPDYNERTRIIGYRYLMGILGALIMTLYAYKVIFREDEDNPDGLLSAAGYETYGIIASIVIFLSIMIAALGSHHRIRYLPKVKKRKIRSGQLVKEVIDTLSHTDLWRLAIGGFFTAVAIGVSEGLNIYFHLYFWELTPQLLANLVFAGMGGAAAAVFLTPRLSARFGKKHTAIMCYAAAVVVTITPLSIKLMGFMPPNGSPVVIWVLTFELFFSALLTYIGNILVTSMFTDLTEASEVKTGRRSEGLLLSSDNVLKKTANGAGVFVSGMFLAIFAFPEKARPGQVDESILNSLAIAFIACLVIFYAISIVLLMTYRITQDVHEQNLRVLRERKLVDNRQPSTSDGP